MKKIFTFSAITILALVLFTGCVKDRSYIDESYWLSQERGVVVHSDPYCSYYVVETNYGYTIVRASGSYKPYENAVVYGNFSNYGYRDFYNGSSGIVFRGEVIEYWLTYYEAQQAISYYCY